MKKENQHTDDIRRRCIQNLYLDSPKANAKERKEKENQHAHDTQSFRHHRLLACSPFVLTGWDVRHFEDDVIYWDIVLITTLDLMQKNAYDALIEQRASINRIPLGVDYFVVTDPAKIGEKEGEGEG